MFEDVARNNVHIGGFKRATWEDHIQAILVLQKLFPKHVILESIFKIHGTSRSTFNEILNMHKVLLLI